MAPLILPLVNLQSEFGYGISEILQQFPAAASPNWSGLGSDILREVIEKWAELVAWLSQPRKSFFSFFFFSLSFSFYLKDKRGASRLQIIYTKVLYRPLSDILAVIIAWSVTFTLTCTIIMCLGFGPVGIVAGKVM